MQSRANSAIRPYCPSIDHQPTAPRDELSQQNESSSVHWSAGTSPKITASYFPQASRELGNWPGLVASIDKTDVGAGTKQHGIDLPRRITREQVSDVASFPTTGAIENQQTAVSC